MTKAAGDPVQGLAAEFEAADLARWRSLAEKVLRGDSLDRRLNHMTADGIVVRPLYHAADALPAGAPGARPFLRGHSSRQMQGWDIRQRHAVNDPAAVNAAILEDLAGGATSIELAGAALADAAVLARALAGVQLELVPIALDTGGGFAAAADGLLRFAAENCPDPAIFRAHLNADPLGAAARDGRSDASDLMAPLTDLARSAAARFPRVVTVLADGRPFHAAGASEALEVACAVASGIAYLRALTDTGMPTVAAARQIGLALVADTDFFLSLAKLRAVRRLWGRVLEVGGALPAMADLHLHLETASRMLTRLDPFTNILRGTVAAFAAACGGATSITVLPFDHALGPTSPRARRLARNTQLVLLEEACLGRVQDPAGGSWFVERLTEDLAAEAWKIVQEIERRGGMVAALRTGWPQRQVAAGRKELERAVHTRRLSVVGVSEFLDLTEPPLGPSPPAVSGAGAGLAPFRLAAGLEAQRQRGDSILARTGRRPKVHLCSLGTPESVRGRAAAACALFEAGGFAISAGTPSEAVTDVVAAFTGSGARQALICVGPGAETGSVAALARALREAGAQRLHLVGRPDGASDAAWHAVGIDELVHAEADALAILQRAHDAEAGDMR